MTREIWVFSNFPPPVHGVSVFNVALTNEFERRGVPYRRFEIGTRGSLTSVEQFQTQKLVSDTVQLSRLTAVLGLARRRRIQPIIYFTPSQRGSAVFRDLALAGIASLFQVPLVGHIHGCGWLAEWRRGVATSRAMFATLRACREIICLGPTYAEEMTHATGLRSVGVNNGVAVGTGHAPKVLGVDRIELLYLSNLIKSKGLWTAARAAAHLRERGRRVRLRCAGSWMRDSERAEFEAEFAVEIANGTVELVGFADAERKRQLLRECQFFLLPTSYPLEGQPLSIIEAMAHGCVPITTTQGAIADLFGFPGWQQLATDRHRDPGTVADSIDALLDDTHEFERLSRECVSRYEAALTIDRCCSSVIEILDRAAR